MSGKVGRISKFGVLVALVAVAASGSKIVLGERAGSNLSTKPIYLDRRAATERRVKDLLGRMTLAEKVGQMTLISVSRLRGDCQGTVGALSPACLGHVLGTDRVGAILSGGGESPNPNTPRAWAEMTGNIQRYAMQHSRLHIPVLYGADAVHGHNNVLGATIFPQNLGLGATRDPALVQELAAATAADMRATGVHWTFSPVSDVARDLRWGRYYETFGEDPYLVSGMVQSAVRGYQGNQYSTGVAATLKHFLGYSEPVNGQDRVFAELPLRYLRQTFYPPFQAGIRAGAASVMVNSGSIDGVPAHASHFLLTDTLRKQMRFTGFTVSDWGDVDALYSRYHVASSSRDAVAMAVRAGVDMAMVPYDADAFTHDLVALVRAGSVPMSRINEAVSRILTVKFELGLFDRPVTDPATANKKVLGAHRDLALRAAEESLTLLRNQQHLLPVSHPTSILVTGSAANSIPDQMGGWTVGWQGVTQSPFPPAVTALQGIRAEAPRGTRVVYANPADPAAARRAASKASVTVVVVGEPPYAEGMGDTSTASLQGIDTRVLRTVLATHKPVVVVLVAGRPLILGDIVQPAPAILMAWLPGTEGGDAIARALFGKYDPGGRLPVSWPRNIGQAPLFYTALPGTSSDANRQYDPLFPFGFGLSYTDFSAGSLSVRAPSTRSGTIHVSVHVSNRGTRSGDDTVEVYVHEENSSVLQPPRRLVAFQRVHLGSRASRTVKISIPTSRLAQIPGDIPGNAPWTVDPGRYTFMVAGSQRVISIR